MLTIVITKPVVAVIAGGAREIKMETVGAGAARVTHTQRHTPGEERHGPPLQGVRVEWLGWSS